MDPLTGIAAALVAFQTGTAIGKVVNDITDLLNPDDDLPTEFVGDDQLSDDKASALSQESREVANG